MAAGTCTDQLLPDEFQTVVLHVQSATAQRKLTVLCTVTLQSFRCSAVLVLIAALPDCFRDR